MDRYKLKTDAKNGAKSVRLTDGPKTPKTGRIELICGWQNGRISLTKPAENKCSEIKFTAL
ncbi:hypothetical protein GCM10028804_26660 [Larkinella terrae]